MAVVASAAGLSSVVFVSGVSVPSATVVRLSPVADVSVVTASSPAVVISSEDCVWAVAVVCTAGSGESFAQEHKASDTAAARSMAAMGLTAFM